MTTTSQFQPERGDVRRFRRSNPLAHIIRELPSRIERLAPELRCPPDGRVLDYGCADVPYRRFFPTTVDYLAADLPGNPQATVLVGDDGTLPVADGSVDVVLSTQVLEHVSDPAVYLRECHRVMRPGARMLLSTHGFMTYHPDPVDLWRWTCAGLREAVARSGLEVVRFEGIMGLTATGFQFVQDGLLYRLPRRLRPLFAGAMQGLVMIADRREPDEIRDRNALVFALIAEKPAATVTP
jgi:SAM-dependent methyltransferase